VEGVSAAEGSAATLIDEIRRSVARSGWTASVAGAVAVFVVIGFLLPLFGDAHKMLRIGLVNGPLVVLYVGLSGLAVHRHFNQVIVATTGWLAEGRAPTQDEYRRTLRLALQAVKLEALAWAAGGLVFGVLDAIVDSWGFAAVVTTTICLGGEMTCALSYLFYERILQPLTARALETRPYQGAALLGVRERLMMSWSVGTGVPLLGVLVVGAVGLTKSGVHTTYVASCALALGAVAIITGLIATVFVSRAIADPLLELRSRLEQVERGELDVGVQVDDLGEIGLLQSGFNRMADGLRERARIRDLFGRQVGEEVARAALEEGVVLGGEERQIGALFVDMVGSTALALEVTPTEVVATLNRFFAVVIEVLRDEGGLVNKFEGDAALCIFGAPVACEDPAGQALRAAQSMAERFTHDLPDIDFGIGVSAGVAVAGNVGAEDRFEYTVIGDPVNEASRLSDLAKQRPERVIASHAALRLAAPATAAQWNLTGSVVLRGRDAPTGLAHPRDR
jgi:adenylate cyclase